MYARQLILPAPPIIVIKGMNWTSDDDDVLRKLYKSRTALYLSKKLGRTRNAVLGRAHRLGLTREKTKRADRGLLVSVPKTFAVVRDDGPNFAPRGGAVALADLGVDDCRWPCGDKFCGAKANGGKSYCKEHHAIAYPEEIQL